MNFRSICNDTVTVERSDGTRREDVPALVKPEMILVADETIPIQPGDVILRKLPSGIVERMVVTDPGFVAKFREVPGHYRVKYQREGAQPAGHPGYVVHVNGPNSRVNIGSVDNSNNFVAEGSFDAVKLATDLKALREALVPEASDPEHFVTIGQLSSAEIAAANGDASKASVALAALGTAGKWAWDMANKIGAGVAAGVIKTQLGL